jgi:hypothetical protein
VIWAFVRFAVPPIVRFVAARFPSKYPEPATESASEGVVVPMPTKPWSVMRYTSAPAAFDATKIGCVLVEFCNASNAFGESTPIPTSRVDVAYTNPPLSTFNDPA